MAGHSSPTLPVPCTSARLQTSKFGKPQRDCFHSLPCIRPEPWNCSRSCFPDAEDGPAASTATIPEEQSRALPSDSDGRNSQDPESRRPRSPRQMAADERRLVRVPVSWPLRSTAEATAKNFFSQSGALSGEPSPWYGTVLGTCRTADSARRPKAPSTVLNTVNLEASLRLVPQATSTPTIIARMAERSRSPSHRSRGEDVGVSRPKMIPRASSQPRKESEKLGDVRWIDRGPVVSPTHAVVLRSPLKIWRKAPPVGDKEEVTKDVSTQPTLRGSPSDSGVLEKTKALQDQERGRSDGAGRRTPASKAWVDAVPLFLLLVVLCLLCLWGLRVLRNNTGKNVAYSALKPPKRPGETGVGDSLTVPPEVDGSEAAVRGQYRKRTQDQEEDLGRGGAIINGPFLERSDSYGGPTDGRTEQDGAVDNSDNARRGVSASDITDVHTAGAHGNATEQAKAE
ncbi:hypothetical protein HPB50_000056 [Hyalomma asiaticum]|uniref:Uncharacterized protein n=1 Tax=Hyalomma asiaticum TaxID=266040 RepID=A0ACB7SU06_HYAAI|nr:hypothetical protein HPB50_000056 [Hyalomma asiaticum]